MTVHLRQRLSLSAVPTACTNLECRGGCAGYPTALGLGLRSAYVEALGAEPAYTTYKRRGASVTKHVIDYILVSEDVGVSRVLLPPPEDEIDASALPGWRYPSDHVALAAELALPASDAAI